MLKKQIEEKISKTEIFNINKKTAEFILQKLNEFLDKEDSIFILMDVMKCTDYSYHTIRKYINAIIAFKPSLVVKLDRYRYMLNNRNKADLHLDDITFPTKKSFGKLKRQASVTLSDIYTKYKNKTFTLKNMATDFNISYNLAYRTMRKIVNTEGLENILNINTDSSLVSFTFNVKEMKKIGY